MRINRRRCSRHAELPARAPTRTSESDRAPTPTSRTRMELQRPSVGATSSPSARSSSDGGSVDARCGNSASPSRAVSNHRRRSSATRRSASSDPRVRVTPMRPSAASSSASASGSLSNHRISRSAHAGVEPLVTVAGGFGSATVDVCVDAPVVALGFGSSILESFVPQAATRNNAAPRKTREVHTISVGSTRVTESAADRPARVESFADHSGQLRGTSLQGTSRSTRTSPGRPNTRSPRMFCMTSVVPPSIEFARDRRKRCCGVAPPAAVSGRTIS